MRDIKNNSHRIPNFLSPLAIKELLQSLNSDKVSRFSFSQNYLNKFILFLKKKNFYFKISDPIYHKFDKRFSKWSAHNFSKYKKGLTESFFIYFGSNKSKVFKAYNFELNNKHYETGKLLKIPECCARQFVINLRSLKKNNYDFVPQVIKNSSHLTKPYNFLNNIIAQFNGYSLLSYAPCSFNCKKSLKYAKQSLKLLKKYKANLHKNFIDKLSYSSIYFKKKKPIFFLYKQVKKNFYKIKILKNSANEKKIFLYSNLSHNLIWKNNYNFRFDNKFLNNYIKKNKGRVALFEKK